MFIYITRTNVRPSLISNEQALNAAGSRKRILVHPLHGRRHSLAVEHRLVGPVHPQD
jgi:hypothetical protein